MGEVNGDPPLGRRNDLPDAVLVAENGDDDNVVGVALNIFNSIVVVVIIVMAMMISQMQFLLLKMQLGLDRIPEMP